MCVCVRARARVGCVGGWGGGGVRECLRAYVFPKMKYYNINDYAYVACNNQYRNVIFHGKAPGVIVSTV